MRWLFATNVKKMFSKKKPDNFHFKVVDFIPPQRHDGRESYVWFSQVDPMTGRMKRKKYMLDRFREGRERDVAANRIIANIYNQVSRGWNVWAPENTTRSDSLVDEVLERYVGLTTKAVLEYSEDPYLYESLRVGMGFELEALENAD